MNPWVTITLVTAGIVFVLDYLVRRKKWKDNATAEKVSLIVNMFSVGPYIFASGLGMLWGITGIRPESALGKMLYEVTLTMGGTYYIVAIAAAILSLVFRKTGKTKASIWINVIALLYIVVVLGVNSLVGELL